MQRTIQNAVMMIKKCTTIGHRINCLARMPVSIYHVSFTHIILRIQDLNGMLMNGKHTHIHTYRLHWLIRNSYEIKIKSENLSISNELPMYTHSNAPTAILVFIALSIATLLRFIINRNCLIPEAFSRKSFSHFFSFKMRILLICCINVSICK